MYGRLHRTHRGAIAGIASGIPKKAGLTQAAAALRLGITQQTLSALERNAEKVGADRLLQLLSILGVELVLREPEEPLASRQVSDQDW